MADENKHYYAVDMANGLTYIGESRNTVSGTTLNDIVVVETKHHQLIANLNVKSVASPKDYYISQYQAIAGFALDQGLGKSSLLKEMILSSRSNLDFLPGIIAKWYLGIDILDKKK